MRTLVCRLTLMLMCTTGAVSAALSEAGVGEWIWDATTLDRQECRFVRTFEVPNGGEVESAILRITADNSYSLFLDGQPIGQGGDWRVLIEYDVTQLLGTGPHVLAVRALNDFDVAGLLVGLRISLKGGGEIEIGSDASWALAPEDFADWRTSTRHFGEWRKAVVLDHYGASSNPQVYRAPVSLPQPLGLWQKRWFQVAVVAVGALGLATGLILAGLLVLKSQAARIVRRERTRIAADLHDNLGGGLTQLVLLGEAAKREAGAPGAPGASAGAAAVAEKLGSLCAQARALAIGMNETVWLINSQRDTVRDLATYIARHAEAFFRDSAVRCRFEIDENLPDAPCDLGVRRNLFLAAKEAMNNVLRHSGADEVELRIESRRGLLRIAIRDNGRGFVSASVLPGEGLRNLSLRAREAGGRFALESAPGQGTTVEFWVPIAARSRLGAA